MLDETVVSAVIIRKGEILLVSEGDGIWTLPGGKLEENDQTDKQALAREIKEELGVELIEPEFFRTFEGITPRTNRLVFTRVFFAEIKGKVQPGLEIKKAEWTGKPEKYSLSAITRKIIRTLCKEGCL